MPSLKVVLDTNALLRCISRKSSYALVLDKLFEGAFEMYLTTPIVLEYEEKVADIFSEETADLLIGAFILLPNVKKIDIHFHLNLIPSDTDDNKFVDCAFAGNVHYIVTDDRHFNSLKYVEFPSLGVLTLDAFKAILEKE